MLAVTRLKRTGASMASIRSLEMQTPVASMFAANSLDLQLVDEQLKSGKFANPHHYAVLSIDGKSVSKPGHKTPMPSPRWPSFHFNISSTLNITIFRKRRMHKDSLVAQYTGQGRDFLDRDTKYVLTDKTGAQTDLRLSVNIDLTSIPPADFMKSVTDNAAGLQSVGTSAAAQSLGGLGLQIFHILEKIVPAIDAIADAHPLLKMTWTVLSSVYKAVKDQMDQDAAVCDLATSLQEMLGVANICPELVRIEDTDDVITEIRRAALEGALLIAEYVGTNSLAGRTAKHQLSDMSDRITQCQKRYTDLGGKFNRRVQLETRATVKKTDATVTETQVTVKETDARVQWIQDVQMEGNIEKWMDAPDTSPNFNAARKKHQPDTGAWFLDGPAFTRWKEDPDFLLWLNSGLLLSSRALSASAIPYHLQATRTFFDGTSAQAALWEHDKLIRSIIMQLSRRCDGIPPALAEMYGKCDKGRFQPPIEMLEATLLRIVDSFDSVYIMIDSLDECSKRTDLLHWIQSVVSAGSGKIHMMVTSRPEEDISRCLRPLSNLEEIRISGNLVETDIGRFIDARLAKSDANKWKTAQKDMIRDVLISDADGMFRWVGLQADRLIMCASTQELKKQLKSLPRDLNETYSRILSESPDPGNLKRILQWLAYSRRAMAIEEIAEVAAIDFGDGDSGLPMYEADRRFADPKHVFSLCYGLITEAEVNIESEPWPTPIWKRFVKLAHFSVKEYLISEHILSGAAGNFHTDEQLSHSVIAETSLAYLLHFDKPGSLSKDTLPLFTLARYAAEHWVAHSHSAGSNRGNTAALQQLQLRFFTPSPPSAMHNSLHLYDVEKRPHRNFDRKVEDFAHPFYYACRFGLTTVVAHLISKGADVNGNRGWIGPPLTAASKQGHLETVQLLLAHGADVAGGGKYSGNALQEAARRGHLEIVELLLAHGADIGAGSGEIDGTALQRAALQGHVAIIQFLLSHGADANEPEESIRGHALSMASSQGHLEIVQLLLVHGAEVDAAGGMMREPALLQASGNGHLEIVQLLLAHGAHVNAKSILGDAALAKASAERHVAIVELLREHGAVEGGRSSSSACSSSSADDASGVGSPLEESASEEEEDEG